MFVFELLSPSAVDNGKYDYLYSPNVAEGVELLRTMFPIDAYSSSFASPFLSSKWDNYEVSRCAGVGVQRGDYPCIDLSIPAISSSIASRMGSILERHGQIFRLRCYDGDYVMWNIRELLGIDSVNQSKSLIQMMRGDPKRSEKCAFAESIAALDIREEYLADRSVFRFRAMPHSVLVTESFIESLARCGAKGFFVRKCEEGAVPTEIM